MKRRHLGNKRDKKEHVHQNEKGVMPFSVFDGALFFHFPLIAPGQDHLRNPLGSKEYDKQPKH